MAVYVMVTVKISDPSWVEDYIPAVQAQVEQAGGRYLVRSTEFELVEADGPKPDVAVIIEFPSKEAAQTFYTSDAYRPFLEARQAGSKAELILVEGL